LLVIDVVVDCASGEGHVGVDEGGDNDALVYGELDVHFGRE
jgi:hypothetical protein